MHFSLPTMRQPRNPLLRALSLIVGLAVIGVFLVFGLFVFGVLLVGGVVLLALRRWKMRSGRVGATTSPSGSHNPQVLEGEFVVIQQQGRPVTH